MKRLFIGISIIVLAISTGCGGGSGGGSDSGACPAGATLTLAPKPTTVPVGGIPITFYAGLSGCTEMVAWSLTGPGNLAPQSGGPAVYTPPTTGAGTSVTITITAGGLADHVTFSLAAGSADWTGTAVSSAPNGSGAISLTFASSVPTSILASDQAAASLLAALSVNVTGTFKTGTLTVSLIGTYDSTTQTFTASGTGGGGTYAFTGTVTTTSITGTFTLVSAGVTYPGTFTAAPGGSGTVTVYCGTYTGTSSGTWNLVKTGTTVTGIASTSGGNAPLTGTVNGSSLSITYPGGSGLTGSATGTISGTSVSGTWQNSGAGESGTFTGTTNC